MPFGWVAAATAASGALSASAAGDAANKQQQGTDKAVAASQGQYNQTRSDLAPYRTAGAAALSRLNTLLGISDPTLPSNEDMSKLPGFNDLCNNNVASGMKYDTPDAVESLRQATAKQWSAKNGAIPGASTPSSDPAFGSLLSKFSTADLNADPVYNSGLQFGLDQGTKAINQRALASGSYDSGATLKALTQYANDYGSTKAADSQARFVNDQNSEYQKLAGISGMGLSGAGATSSAGTGNASNLANLYSSQGNANAASGIAGSNAISSGINSGINNYNQYQLLQQLTAGGQRTTAAPASSTYSDPTFAGIPP